MLFITPSSGQPRAKAITLDQEVTTVAIDRPGDLYASQGNGKVVRIDSDGSVSSIDHLVRAPTLFDPRDGSRLFAYYRDEQRYAYLSMTREMSSHAVDSAFAIQPWLVCPSGDYNVWIADAADNTIRKINNITARIDAEIKFSSIVSDITYMREYQGFLFVLQPSRGIVIYSGMGRELRTLGNASDAKKLLWFNFLGEELYYPDNDRLVFFNLFTTETHTVKRSPSAAFTLLTDTRRYTVTGRRIEVVEAPR